MTRATGQVEREARQLVEAAARWLSAVPDDHEYAVRTGDLEPDAQASAGSSSGWVSEEGPQGAGDAGRAPARETWAGQEEQRQEQQRQEQEQEQREEQGQEQEQASAEEHVCRGCPWCRAKVAAGPIGADTLDSIAHLLSTAAESLSLFAQSRREASHDTDADAGPTGAVIDWEDEDEDEFRAGEGEQPKQSPTRERKTR